MSLRVCAGCSTRYSVDLAACPHCGSAEYEAARERLPLFVTASCASCVKQWHLRLNLVQSGLLELPNLRCASCGCQVQVPCPPVEDSMPKITVHGGATNAREDGTSPVVVASPPPVVAEGGRGPSSETALVGEPGPELVDVGESQSVDAPELDEFQAEPEPEVAPDYDSMTLAELRELSKERDLPVYGNKAEVIGRLREADGA